MGMGYALVWGYCWACGFMMGYNPMSVPSIRIKDGVPDPDGIREALCKSCITKANVQRKKQGQPEFQIRPDAYEPIDASAL